MNTDVLRMSLEPAAPAQCAAEAPSHFAQPLRKTPFHARARALSQLDSFVAWAGYTTVDVFTSIEQEYFAIRNSCSLYDLTPMVKYRIAGADARPFLDRLVTRNLDPLRIGRVLYCLWCDDAGHLIDDGTLFRLGESEYRLCTAEHQLDWLLASAVGFDVRIEEITRSIAALSLQGPTAWSVLQASGITGVERLKPFDCDTFHLGGVELLVSRTGFTGDLGYELWIDPAHAERLWDALMSGGRSRGIRPIGSRALNIARIEAGFLQPHVDFISSARALRFARERSPLQLGLAWQIDFGKGHFTGRRALLAERDRPARHRLVGLDIDGTHPAHNALLYEDRSARHAIGSVTSATWSPTCKCNIALAMLDAPPFEIGRTVWAEIYLNRELVWERRLARARIVARPFFFPARRKATPPGVF